MEGKGNPKSALSEHGVSWSQSGHQSICFSVLGVGNSSKHVPSVPRLQFSGIPGIARPHPWHPRNAGLQRCKFRGARFLQNHQSWADWRFPDPSSLQWDSRSCKHYSRYPAHVTLRGTQHVRCSHHIDGVTFEDLRIENQRRAVLRCVADAKQAVGRLNGPALPTERKTANAWRRHSAE
jgi:hypothetical protein